MKKIIIAAAIVVWISGCSTILSNYTMDTTQPLHTPESPGEMQSGYTYIPVDPFSVKILPGNNCIDEDHWERQVYEKLLDALPDNAVRMLIERLDLSGNVSYGVLKTGIKGESYRVIIDYINADTINVPFKVEKSMRLKSNNEFKRVHMLLPPGSEFEPGSEAYRVSRADPQLEKGLLEEVFNIPVYIGVGLRVSSNIYVAGASANISGIGIIGAEAEAGRLKGSLVVQTLGVNGKSIAAALPIQSELNRTTAQNAIVAVGSIKALLYANETVKSPRVVGLHLPFPGGKQLVNAIISELSKKPVEWEYPCRMQVKDPLKEGNKKIY
jgi:hypothetical protein